MWFVHEPVSRVVLLLLPSHCQVSAGHLLTDGLIRGIYPNYYWHKEGNKTTELNQNYYLAKEFIKYSWFETCSCSFNLVNLQSPYTYLLYNFESSHI